MSLLELTEVNTSAKDRTRFENKWVYDTLNKSDDFQISKVSKMVFEAFQVFNTIIKLTLVDNDASQRS